MKEFNYLSINRTPKSTLLSDEEDNILTMNIITTLAGIQDDSIGKEINKYFNMLIPNNGEDLLQINIKQSKMYLKQFTIQKDYINTVVNQILMYDDTASFTLDKVNTELLAIILATIYKSLSSTAKSYKIVKLIAPYLILDNRKDIFIDEVIEEISLKETKTIQSFDFQFQLFQIVHIENLI